MNPQVAVALLTLTAMLRQCSAPPPIEYGQAQAFRDACGVNVHLQYQDTSYADVRRVRKAAAYLGCRHLRDSALRHGYDAFDHFVELGQAGWRFDLFLNAPLDAQLRRVWQLERAAPGAVALLEGPNEVNNDAVEVAGRKGSAAAQIYQSDLYQAVRAHMQLAQIPVLNFTDWPPTTGRADAVNVHSYPRRGESSARQLAYDAGLSAAAQPPGQAVYVTETGYSTAGPAGAKDVVTPSEQADLEMIALLDAFRAGVRRTYLYELLDEEPDAAGRYETEHHYGLFDAAGRPKPAAQAIHALMALLDARFEPKAFSRAGVTVRGRGVRKLLLDRSDGRSILILWRESERATRLSVIPVRVDLARPRRWRRASLFETGSPRVTPDEFGAQSWDSTLGGSPMAYVLEPPLERGQIEVTVRPRAPSKRPSATARK